MLLLLWFRQPSPAERSDLLTGQLTQHAQLVQWGQFKEAHVPCSTTNAITTTFGQVCSFLFPASTTIVGLDFLPLSALPASPLSVWTSFLSMPCQHHHCWFRFHSSQCPASTTIVGLDFVPLNALPASPSPIPSSWLLLCLRSSLHHQQERM